MLQWQRYFVYELEEKLGNNILRIGKTECVPYSLKKLLSLKDLSRYNVLIKR